MCRVSPHRSCTLPSLPALRVPFSVHARIPATLSRSCDGSAVWSFPLPCLSCRLERLGTDGLKPFRPAFPYTVFLKHSGAHQHPAASQPSGPVLLRSRIGENQLRSVRSPGPLRSARCPRFLGPGAAGEERTTNRSPIMYKTRCLTNYVCTWPRTAPNCATYTKSIFPVLCLVVSVCVPVNQIHCRRVSGLTVAIA